MAGTGKGILRTAIEDFLETFDMGKVLFGWWKTVIEKFEDEAIELYKELAQKTGLSEYLPQGVTTKDMTEGLTRRPVKIVPIIIGIGMMVIGLFVGMLQPLQRLGNYKVDRKIKSYRPTPIEAFAMERRTGKSIGDAYELLSDLGLSKELIDGYKELSRQLLSPYDYITAWRRGYISDGDIMERLTQVGLDVTNIETLKKITEVIPGVQDLIRFSVREAFSENIIQKYNYGAEFPENMLQYTRKQGIPDEWVKRYWYAHWILPSPQQAYEMLHRLRPGRSDITFDKDDLNTLFTIADYAPHFRPYLEAISYNPITRVDIRRMYRIGVIDAEEVKQRYMDIGYTDKDAELLKDFTVRYETGTGVDKDEEYQKLSKSVLEKMYKKGALDETQFRERLEKLRYGAEEIELIITLAKQEMSEDMYLDYKKQFVTDTIKDVRNAYNASMISENVSREVLTALGISQTNIEYIIKSEKYQMELSDLNSKISDISKAFLSGAIDYDKLVSSLSSLNISGEQLTRITTDLQHSKLYPTKLLTESQYRAAAKQGLITVEKYRDKMYDLGYTLEDADLLVRLYFAEEL